jgi:hypothetical protein
LFAARGAIGATMSNANRADLPYDSRGRIRSAGILPAFFRPATPDKIAATMPALRSTVCPATEMIVRMATIGLAGRRAFLF